MAEHCVWAVVLAAGLATRMGGLSKPLLPVGGEPMVRRVVRAALRGGAAGAVVVAGPHAEAVRRAVAEEGERVRMVFNPYHATGMASSLRAGVAALPEQACGALVLLADQPWVSAALVARVIAAGQGVLAAACRYPDGGPGPPCLLDRAVWPRLRELQGDQGARRLLRDLAGQLRLVAAPEQELRDVDRPEDLAALAEGLAPGPEG